jgi:hypothetical protein
MDPLVSGNRRMRSTDPFRETRVLLRKINKVASLAGDAAATRGEIRNALESILKLGGQLLLTWKREKLTAGRKGPRVHRWWRLRRNRRRPAGRPGPRQ